MSSEEFRDELREIVQRHNPSADTLRDVAGDFETLADRYEATEDVL